MATIRRYPFLSHLRSAPTMYAVHTSAGRLRHTGPGTAFWFRPLSAAISEVPVDDRELPVVAHARTADLQDVTVALTVSFRFAEPETVAQRIDFGVDPDTGAWSATPLEQVEQVVTESASALARDAVATLTVARAVTAGTADLADRIVSGLRSDDRLVSTGIGVLGVRIRAVRADADMERALQTPAREAAQTEADAATSTRRALAVDRERAIAENELANRIELAAREAGLVAQEGLNARRRAEEAAAAALVETTARVERDDLVAGAQAQRTRTLGAAEADAQAARLAAYDGVDPSVLTALTLQELARHLPEIGHLTVTPDLLTTALAGLVGPKES
ncbi:MAG: SPFH domain-containing protein [Candidatus Nanopelagicales bacterium]